jgi:hypothetical protein
MGSTCPRAFEIPFVNLRWKRYNFETGKDGRLIHDGGAAGTFKMGHGGKGNLLEAPVICVTQGVGLGLVHSPSDLEKPNRGTCHL